MSRLFNGFSGVQRRHGGRPSRPCKWKGEMAGVSNLHGGGSRWLKREKLSHLNSVFIEKRLSDGVYPCRHASGLEGLMCSVSTSGA